MIEPRFFRVADDEWVKGSGKHGFMAFIHEVNRICTDQGLAPVFGSPVSTGKDDRGYYVEEYTQARVIHPFSKGNDEGYRIVALDPDLFPLWGAGRGCRRPDPRASLELGPGQAMRFELMISSQEDGFRWISNDIEKDFGSERYPSMAIGTAVLSMVERSRERASRPVPPPRPPTKRDLARIKAKGHDCFLDENEVVHQNGNSIWTTCRLCGDVISAG